MPKKKSKEKHVPQRTCVGCREVLPKRKLIRLVRTSTGIQLDPSGKLPGRGAYLHEHRSCWERGINGKLAQALKMNLSAEDRRLLLEYMAGLPDETADREEPDEV